MRVLLCTNSFEKVVNGPAKFANLILEINERYPQHQIRILTEDISIAHNYVYPLHLKIPRGFMLFSQLLRMFIYHRRAIQIHEDFPYDVLIYNNSFIGLWSALVSKQPTVGMINDDNNLSVTFAKFKLSKTWIKRILFKSLEYLSIRYHSKIISNSDYLTLQILNTYEPEKSKIYKLYKSVDLPAYSLNDERKFENPIKVLFIKADYVRGGLKTLADAVSLLKDYQFEVIIIGTEKKFKHHIMSFFDRTEHASILILGEQSQEVVLRFLKEADIFCVPSQKEALGVANIEALASGIAVVSTNVGGIPEVLDNGNNGWLVKPNVPEELAFALRECIENEGKRREKIRNGGNYIKKFSKEVMFDCLIQILESKRSD